MKNDLVEVCKLGKTVGLKGAIKLHNFSDFPNQFKKGTKFYDKFGNEFVIKSFNSQNFLVVFENYENIDLAKTLTNLILYRTIEDTKKYCKLSKDEFFYFDVIGCEVIENDSALGVVNDILEAGGGFLFEIRTAAKFENLSKQFYIPYQDHFIERVDIQSKKIYVKNSLDILENS